MKALVTLPFLVFLFSCNNNDILLQLEERLKEPTLHTCEDVGPFSPSAIITIQATDGICTLNSNNRVEFKPATSDYSDIDRCEVYSNSCRTEVELDYSVPSDIKCSGNLTFCDL